MKKIFFSLMAVLFALNVSAQKEATTSDVIVDGYVDFSEQTELKFYGWGNTGGKVKLKDGCLYYNSDAATENPWDIQYSPLGDMNIIEGVPYTVTIELKGSPAGNVFNWSMGGVEHYGQLGYTEKFSIYESTLVATKDDNRFFIQHGNIVGELWIKSIKVTHKAEDVKEIEWTDILVNGDAEGAYAVVPCAVSKVNWGEQAGSTLPAQVVTLDGNKVFAIKTGDKVAEAWDNQFWIQSPVAFKAGDNIKVSFKYKAEKDAKATTQQHAAPGAYQHWAAIGDVNFTTDWKLFEANCQVEKDDMQTIAFNLNEMAESNTYYFDNIKLLVNPEKVNVPENQEAGETPTELDLNMAAAQIEYAKWETLCNQLTKAMAGNEEYILGDTRQAIEDFMSGVYPMLIEIALEESAETGEYTSLIDWEQAEENVAEWIAEIEDVKNGVIPMHYLLGATVAYDEEASEEYAFLNKNVGVEITSKNTIYLRGWAGVEGYDLKIDTQYSEEDECYNGTALTVYINGEEQTATPVEVAEGNYRLEVATGRTDVPTAKIWFTDETTPFVQAVTGEEGLVFIGLDIPGNEKVGSYCVMWPAEEIVEPVEADPLYTAAGSVMVDEEWESDYQTAHNVDGILTVDAYEDYVIIRDFDGVEGYDLKVGFDEEENVTAVSVLHNGEETDATAGWANSGKANWYVYGDYSYAGSDPGTESGYVILSAYVGNDYVYYYVAWGEEDDPTTGINNTTVNNLAKGEIYNLAGQKVDAQYKGIVIKNGKKVLVK